MGEWTQLEGIDAAVIEAHAALECPRCGSTRRNRSTLHCVCGANVTVPGQQELFTEESDGTDRDH